MFYSGDPEFSFKRRCISTEVKFAFLPKICYTSKKIIWLKTAYKQTAMYTGPDFPSFEYRWYDKHEFLMQKLRDGL